MKNEMISIAPFRLEILSPKGQNLGVFSLTAGQTASILLALKCKLDYDKDISASLIDETEEAKAEVDEYTKMMNRCWDTMDSVYKSIDISTTDKRHKDWYGGKDIDDEDQE